MKITILAIGKKHDPLLMRAIEEYSARASHYVKIEWKLVEAKITGTMPEAHIRKIESEALLSQINPGEIVILLDEHGTEVDSPTLAQKLQSYMSQSTKTVTVVIGGAYGVDETISKIADFTWSLSKLVFPHQLVRLILIEQLYRAHTILAGEKYHHQ